jgi:hypothetical protein
MATTIAQQLVELAHRAVKAGVKTGDDFADYVRKHAPKLSHSNISYLYLAFRIVRKPEQYGAALSQIKAGSTEAMSKLVKACQKTRGTTTKIKDIDARLAAALSIENKTLTKTLAQRRAAKTKSNVAHSVYEDMVRKATENARKAAKK